MLSKSFGALGVWLLAALLLVGCQSSGKESSDMMMSDSAVVSVTNQGAVTFLPGHGGSVMVLSSSGAHTCEQCKTDATAYFSTGKMTEKCSACGATRYAVMRGK